MLVKALAVVLVYSPGPLILYGFCTDHFIAVEIGFALVCLLSINSATPPPGRGK